MVSCRSSPGFQSGTRTSSALGGGSLTSAARGAGGLLAMYSCQLLAGPGVGLGTTVGCGVGVGSEIAALISGDL